MWFIIGVIVNAIGILLVIGDAVYETFTSGEISEGSAMYQVAAVIVFLIVAVAFALRANGLNTAANVLLWIPGVPISLFYLYVVLLLVAGPTNWR